MWLYSRYFGGMKIRVPESVADLTVGQFMQLATTTEPLEMLAIACGVDVETIRSMEQGSLERVLEVIGDLNTTGGEHPLIRHVDIGGVACGFLPGWDDLSVGEYADLEMACQDLAVGLPRALSVMYRPVTWRGGAHYECAPYKPVLDLAPYREVSMAVALGAVGFFLRTAQASLMSSRPSLMAGLRAAAWLKSGVSMPRFTT